MTKKKLLFMLDSMPIGGIESALLALLAAIDYEKYSVDLLLVEKTGARLEEIPAEVRVLELDEKARIFVRDAGYSRKQLVRGQQIGWCLRRLNISMKRKTFQIIGKSYDSWEAQSEYVVPWPGTYYAAIDYDGFHNRYVATKVSAGRKLTWSHFDYNWIDGEEENDRKYYAFFDWIVPVSDACASKLKERFPEYAGKIIPIYNIIDRKRIRRMAWESAPEIAGLFGIDEKRPLILCSVGRLQAQKGFPLAVETAACLKQKGTRFIWFIVGEGPDRKKLESEIAEYGLTREVILVGAKNNPYPYMQAADIYVQPSICEGRCVAVTEAQALYKPCVVTDIAGLNDLVEDYVTGRVVRREPSIMADAIAAMSEECREHYSQDLKQRKLDENESMKTFYAMIGG